VRLASRIAARCVPDGSLFLWSRVFELKWLFFLDWIPCTVHSSEFKLLCQILQRIRVISPNSAKACQCSSTAA
jgi:hypothetical protein